MDRAEEVLRSIEKEAKWRYLPIIGAEKARIIAGIVEECNPSNALEVGTNVGYSAIVIASHMREDARLTTIEIDARTSREALENIRRAALSDRITILTGDALALIPQIPAPLDFVFVDAEKVEYGNYLRLFEEKLHAGSIVVADNAGAYPTAMRDYLDRVRNSGHYESRFIPVGWDGLEVSRRL